MKKYLILASAALVTLAACNKQQEIVEPVNQNEEVVLTFTSQRPQIDVDTKTAWNEATSSIVWTSGDAIRVGYTLDGTWQSKGDGEDTTPRLYTSNQVSIDANDAGVGTFTVPINVNSAFIDPEAEGKYVFYGVYPSSAISNTGASSAPSVAASIPSSQENGVNTFDKKADLMIGKTAEMTLTGLPTGPIEIDWTRLVAHGFLTFKDFKNVESGETITKITLTATTAQRNEANTYLAGGINVDLTTGAYSFNSSATNELAIAGSNLAFVQETVNETSMTNLKVWVCVFPETITGLEIDVETNKAHYTRSINGISRTFVENAKNNLPINMSTATRTPKTGQLVEDGYYVISYSDIMMTTGDESKAFRGCDTKDVANPSDEAIWKIEYVSESDAYTIHSLGANKDLFGATTSTSTDLKLGSGTTNLFTIEKSSSEATTYRIAPFGNTSRSIGYNPSNPRFALYVGGDQPITLDLTSVTVNETPVISIDNDERTKDVAASATSVSFTYTPNAFATTAPTVEVASDEDGIVNGNPTAEDGTITVNLNANTENKAKIATLTVSGTGIASPITLTINQEAKVGDVFAYTFTSKSWAATRNNVSEDWTSGKDGSQMGNGGIQVTTGVSGANGTSPYSFTDISEIVVTYCTNASNGVGTIKVTIGEGDTKTFNVTKPSSGGTTPKTASFKYATKESGKVNIEVTCSTNSVFLIGASITAASIDIPAPSITVVTSEASNTASTEGTTATLNGTIALNNGALISDVTEAGFYYKADSGDYQIVAVDSPSTTLTYNLSGLTPSTVTYTYYAYAVFGGNTVKGDDKTFTTTATGNNPFTPVTVWDDDFSNANDKGGSTVASTWSGSKSGFTGQYSIGYLYPCQGFVKLAKSSQKGMIETPALSISDATKLTVTVKLCNWGTDDTTINITCTNGTPSISSITPTKTHNATNSAPSAWDEYEFTITNVSTGFKLKFESSANGKKYFIDDLKIVTAQ